MTTTSLPRYEAWPSRDQHSWSFIPIPAQVRKVWYDKGCRCMAYPVECHGVTKQQADETAAVCALALAAHFGGIADTSRIKVKGAAKSKR